MTRILVPVDGSESSDRAVRYAVELARRSKPAELRLINVQEPIRAERLNALTTADAMERILREQGIHATASAREIVAKAGFVTECPIEIGDIAETIANYARAHECDEIVMGTRGLSTIKGLLLGSVTTKVLHLADVPVTLIK